MVAQSLISIIFWLATTTAVHGWTAQMDVSLCSQQSLLHLGCKRKFGRREILVKESNDSNHCKEEPYVFNGTVSILDRGEHYLVVSKPPGVLCHRSAWSGRKRKKTSKATGTPEVPMLQRAREAVGKRVNLIHRLDRAASGCLLMSFVESDVHFGNVTATLQESMALSSSEHKTYIALVRGEGLLKGRDFREEGWFEVTRPIKNERGNLKNATSYFRFIASQGSGARNNRPRASLVLARIKTGRWHQIRRHLNGLSHPIIGDSTHGDRKQNREWIEKWDLKPRRTCLHLLKLELPPTTVAPNGISVTDALPRDMMEMLQKHFSPEFLEDAKKALTQEDLCLTPEIEPNVVSVDFVIS